MKYVIMVFQTQIASLIALIFTAGCCLPEYGDSNDILSISQINQLHRPISDRIYFAFTCSFQ